MRREGLAVDAARFAREWLVAFALVAGAAGLLLAAGQRLAGAIAAALCAAAVLGRWGAMRRRGRGFFGGEKQAG